MPALFALLIAASSHAQKLARESEAPKWIKLCEKANAVTKDKDGKDEKKEVNICITMHERIDRDTGMVMLATGLRQIEGQDKQVFMVMLPLGKLIKPGMQVTIYPKDLWEAASLEQRRLEESDGARLRSLRSAYTICHAAGCTAEIEATADLLTSLKTGGGFVLRATNDVGASVAFSVSLEGFAAALEGGPSNRQTQQPPLAITEAIERVKFRAKDQHGQPYHECQIELLSIYDGRVLAAPPPNLPYPEPRALETFVTTFFLAPNPELYLLRILCKGSAETFTSRPRIFPKKSAPALIDLGVIELKRKENPHN
jgi:invasion protein IalB